MSLDGPIKYDLSKFGHIKMKNHDVPLSILESEFNYIRNLIIDNNLQRGFEVATAFGISALAASLGFKETGGMLVSMDAYIEEMYDDAGAYIDEFGKDCIKPGEYPDGLASALFLLRHFDIRNHLALAIGWSPTDTGARIKTIFENKKLDYVFIDAGHFTHWIKQDVDAIFPFLGDGAHVLFHDVYPDSFTPELISYIENLLGGTLEIIIEYPHGENLGKVVVTK